MKNLTNCTCQFMLIDIHHKANTAHKKVCQGCCRGLNWTNSLQLLTKLKQSKRGISNATLTVFTQTMQFFAKSSQIFTVKTVNGRCGTSTRRFITKRWHSRCVWLTLRLCWAVLYDNTVDVHEASKNTKDDIRLWTFIENVEETWRILHKTLTTVSASVFA